MTAGAEGLSLSTGINKIPVLKVNQLSYFKEMYKTFIH